MNPGKSENRLMALIFFAMQSRKSAMLRYEFTMTSDPNLGESMIRTLCRHTVEDNGTIPHISGIVADGVIQ